MLIPVKCFTCGKVLADKYRYYQMSVRKKKGDNVDSVKYLTQQNRDKTPEGITLDELGIDKYCCRRHMLTCVDIE